MDTKNPLSSVLRACSKDEQSELARLAGTSRNYLYHIATLRRTPNVVLAKRICDASTQLHVTSLGRVPKITIEQLAQMAMSQR